MKNVIKGLIIVAAIALVAGILSRLAPISVLGVGARNLIGFAGVLLLLAIALEGLK